MFVLKIFNYFPQSIEFPLSNVNVIIYLFYIVLQDLKQEQCKKLTIVEKSNIFTALYTLYTVGFLAKFKDTDIPFM